MNLKKIYKENTNIFNTNIVFLFITLSLLIYNILNWGNSSDIAKIILSISVGIIIFLDSIINKYKFKNNRIFNILLLITNIYTIFMSITLSYPILWNKNISFYSNNSYVYILISSLILSILFYYNYKIKNKLKYFTLSFISLHISMVFLLYLINIEKYNLLFVLFIPTLLLLLPNKILDKFLNYRFTLIYSTISSLLGSILLMNKLLYYSNLNISYLILFTISIFILIKNFSNKDENIIFKFLKIFFVITLLIMTILYYLVNNYYLLAFPIITIIIYLYGNKIGFKEENCEFIYILGYIFIGITMVLSDKLLLVILLGVLLTIKLILIRKKDNRMFIILSSIFYFILAYRVSLLLDVDISFLLSIYLFLFTIVRLFLLKKYYKETTVIYMLMIFIIFKQNTFFIKPEYLTNNILVLIGTIIFLITNLLEIIELKYKKVYIIYELYNILFFIVLTTQIIHIFGLNNINILLLCMILLYLGLNYLLIKLNPEEIKTTISMLHLFIIANVIFIPTNITSIVLFIFILILLRIKYRKISNINICFNVLSFGFILISILKLDFIFNIIGENIKYYNIGILTITSIIILFILYKRIKKRIKESTN